MTDLILFVGPGETLADRMRASIQAEGIEALVKDAKVHVRTALADSVTEESERTGTQFTAKLDGWSAQWTDPDPKPSVTDPEAFCGWYQYVGTPDSVQRVEVIDHHALAGMLDEWRRKPCPWLASEVEEVADCLKVVTEYIFPEDTFTPLLDKGRCKIVGDPDDGYLLVDTDTGETVPGTIVTRARPQLRLVPKGKAQRAKAKRDVADLLGIAQEIAGGDA